MAFVARPLWFVKSLVREALAVDTVVVFLSPGLDVVSGGILSISWHWMESRRLLESDRARVVACTVPSGPHISRYTHFENEMELRRFSEVLFEYRGTEHLLVHVPESAVGRFLDYITSYRYMLASYRARTFNVMLQNIRFAPSMGDMTALERFGGVTITTAHQRYGTPEVSAEYGVPLYHLSVWIDPRFYQRTSWADKKDILLISQDSHPMKESILARIATELPHLELVTIRNMEYGKVKELFRDSKWSLTFGEGLDGYFIEPTFSGGVGFAVYNDEFFTEDFKGLPTVYPDHETLCASICGDIRRLDNSDAYAEANDAAFRLCANHYRYDEYVGNIRAYYHAVGLI